MYTSCPYFKDGRLPADPSLPRLTEPAPGRHPHPPGGFEARDTPGTEVKKAGGGTRIRRHRGLLLSLIGAVAVLCPASIATAACPLHPLPACVPVGLTGSLVTSSRCGHRPPSVCHAHPRSPRGQQGATGQTGPRGKPGAAGTPGATGAAGTTGAAGAAGPQGQGGPPGAAGPPGGNGAAGAAGQPGTRGPEGLRGVQGEIGAAGPTGATGATGAVGATGTEGASGATGAAGPEGATGASGPQGPAGPPGTSGAAGPEGLRGVQGEIGATGTVGATGAAGAGGGTGATGAAGSQGEAGATGSQGKAGPNGNPGAQGEVGLAGEAGATGSRGPAGAPGPAGETGGQGAPGTEGPRGPAGTPGATGATGPAGSSGLSQYAYIYNLGGETIPLEADVPFDSNGVLTPGIVHIPGAAGITLTTAGTYEVTFSLSGTEPSQMALFVNGTLVPGSVYGSGAGTQQDTGQAIFIAPAGAVLTVRNHTSSAAVGLATPIGGTQQSSNASVVIEKLA
jgi:hypothetical protein